jgi:hypothetical protein
METRLTKSEAAAHLGQLYNEGGRPFTLQVMSGWMRHRTMPHFKVGHRVMFDRAAIERWAAKRWSRNPVTA